MKIKSFARPVADGAGNIPAKKNLSVRVTIRTSQNVLDAIKVFMVKEGISPRKRSLWINEAIEKTHARLLAIRKSASTPEEMTIPLEEIILAYPPSDSSEQLFIRLDSDVNGMCEFWGDLLQQSGVELPDTASRLIHISILEAMN